MPKQPVTINGLAFDALIDSSESYSSDIPQFPTEEGFNVSDTIIVGALNLSMTLYLTNTPVTWANRASPNRVPDAVASLKQMYFLSTPVTIVTSEQTYENMAISSLTIDKNLENGTSREIPISFQQIRIVSSRKTAIPAVSGKDGATGAYAGSAQITGDKKQEGSVDKKGDNAGLAYSMAVASGLITVEGVGGKGRPGNAALSVFG